MIIVSWRKSEDCYIVEQEGEFIKDTEDLHDALIFAFCVRDATNDEDVVITTIKGYEE